MTTRKILPILTIAFLLVGLAACSDSGPTALDDTNDPLPAEETVLASVAPEGGSSGVGVDTVITVEFSHSMDPSMAEYADVHEGDVTGPEVGGTWEWLENDTVLQFTPDGPFQLATDYVVHLGGDMMDADGEHVNMEGHGQQQMGGEWATNDMMMSGHMGGMDGKMDPSEHMGGNWDHPSNGSHGMIFTFTTAG